MTAQRIVATVLACHFVAAFGALGMPPFLGLILQDVAPHTGLRMTGLFYVLPTAAMALSSPIWGAISDRWGRKRSLMRAQLGLAASFLLAGLATDLRVLAIALCLQGLLGGTFSASNAYLARALPTGQLARGLNLTQASARLALIAAPLCIGLLVDGGWRIQHVYLLLAGLPLIAFGLIVGLPSDQGVPGDDGDAGTIAVVDRSTVVERPVPLSTVMACQAGFTIVLVASFPFLVPFAIGHLGVDAGVAGWLFGIPHIVYLAACVPLGRWLRAMAPPRYFALGCLLLAASMPLQIATDSVVVLAIARILMGAGMTLGYLALNVMIAGVVRHERAGQAFGWFDGAAKTATVFAGISAGQLAAGMGTPAVFVGCALLALPVAMLPLATRPSSLRRHLGS